MIIALSGAPGIDGAGTAPGRAAGGAAGRRATSGWTATSPSPSWLLAFGLLWGGFVATAAALLLQGLGGWFVGFTDEQSLAIVAPITEEASKGLFLFLLLWWRRAELDGILDGIVYAGMVGIGFAFVENILYLAAAYNGTDGMGPGGTGAVTGVFVIRCLFSPFAHPLFTTFTGIGVGLAVSSRRRSVRILAPFGGYLLPSARTRPGTRPRSGVSRASWVSTSS